MSATTLDQIVPIMAVSIVTLGLSSILLTGGTIRIGKFEIKRGKDVLDKQINEIASIVKEQNQEIKTSATNSLLKKIFTILSETSISALTPANSAPGIDDLVQSIMDLKESLKADKRENPTWSLVEGLVNNYHKQALRQASIQFWFSIIAAVVGFGFVINELVFTPASSATERLIASIPGLIIDAVAALFFRQAEQTRQRATDLYDRLRVDNERTIAIDLIDTIENENLRSIVKAQLALKIGGVDASIPDLSRLTGQSSNPEQCSNNSVANRGRIECRTTQETPATGLPHSQESSVEPTGP